MKASISLSSLLLPPVQIHLGFVDLALNDKAVDVVELAQRGALKAFTSKGGTRDTHMSPSGAKLRRTTSTTVLQRLLLHPVPRLAPRRVQVRETASQKPSVSAELSSQSLIGTENSHALRSLVYDFQRLAVVLVDLVGGRLKALNELGERIRLRRKGCQYAALRGALTSGMVHIRTSQGRDGAVLLTIFR
eukprot:scaffold2679_cov251-Pinguiococcus_pyrenoidosus.AAC.30